MVNKRFNFANVSRSQWTYILIFTILGFIGSINHSMWRDEMNVWLIAKYSNSLSDFLSNIHYDRGHPGLWHFLVAIAFHIVDNPLAMQVLHWLIATSAIFLLWLFAPFTFRQKILFSFGYLPFYENLLISRNYGLGMLCLFGFCTIFSSRSKTYIGLACLLALLANSNIYGLLIGFALALTLVVELVSDRDLKQTYIQKWWDLLISGIIIIISFLISAYTIFPPVNVAKESVLTEISAESNLEHFLVSLGRILGGYTLLIPNPDRLLDLAVCGIIALVFLVIFLTLFFKKPLALFFFSFSTLLLFIFSYVSFPGRGPRHFGHFYLILISALWLANYWQPQYWLLQHTKFLRRFPLKKIQLFTLMLILYIQFFGGLFGFTRDLIVPYSASRQVANYLQKNQLADEFIVASRDTNMAAVSGYLGRELYYPERDDFGSFSLFLKQKRQEVNRDEVLQKIVELPDEFPNNILLILHKELKESHPQLKITPIQNFKRAWIDTERYYLYAIDRNKNS